MLLLAVFYDFFVVYRFVYVFFVADFYVFFFVADFYALLARRLSSFR